MSIPKTAKETKQEMKTLASSSIPSESSPQTHSRPIAAACVAGCCCYTGAICCLDDPRLLYHLAHSLRLPKTGESFLDELNEL